MKKIPVFLAAACSAIALTVASCSNINCQLNNVVYTTFTFCHEEDSKATEIAIGDTLTVTALGTDSVLLNRAYGQSRMELPMSNAGATDVIVMSFSNAGTDTIWIDHTNYPYYETPECGAAIFHNITGIRATNNTIERVEIVKNSVNYDGLENVKIFFK